MKEKEIMFIIKTAVGIVEKTIAYFSEIAIVLLGIAAVSLLLVIFREEGIIGVWNTIRHDITGVTVKFIPVIIVFFTITGALDHLQKRHSKEFDDIVSGRKGTVKMVALAASLPGPAGGRQLQEAWNDKNSDKTKLLLCLVGMMALNINVLLFRSKVLGGPLTLIWLCMALVMLGEVWLVCRFKPWLWFS